MTDMERKEILHLLPILNQMRDIHDVLVEMSGKLEGVCVMAQEHHKDLTETESQA